MDRSKLGSPSAASTGLRVALLVVLLYIFLVSIGTLGSSFKLFGGGFVDGLIDSASFPLIGLFVGVLATTLVQSSSTTTSIVVAMVGGGTMPVETAIPVIMGANIGTSVTNTLVSLGHVTHSREYSRAIAASTVHDFFNLCAVLLLFPLQWATGFLGKGAAVMSELFGQVGGFKFASPIKLVTKPTVKWIQHAVDDQAWLLLVISLILMFASLRYLVKTLKSLVLSRVEAVFDRVLFRSALRAMGFGLLLTVLVQSSSITTSLIVPLAGAGILTLRQIFPYTLGANVGTTCTAILASLAVGEPGAVTVAFAHLLFNIVGISLIWPVRQVREVPLALARRMAYLAQRNRWIPVAYIVIIFYLAPFLIITLLR